MLAIANAANFSVPPDMDADAAHASVCEWLADARLVCKSRNNNRLHRTRLPVYHFQYVQWISGGSDGRCPELGSVAALA